MIDFSKILYKKYRIAFHVLFWIVGVSVYTLIYGSYENEYFIEFKKNIYALPIKMAATYSLMYILIPHLLYKNKYFLFVIALVASAVLFSTAEWLWLDEFTFHDYDIRDQEVAERNIAFPILVSIIHIYPIALAAASIKIVKVWFNNVKKTQQLENEKLDAELKFLKSQIHPHFLFNTLNNLYALTLKKSEQAPEIVLKLSDLLSYILYEGNVETISLSNELKSLNNYIELEQLRYGKKLTLTKKVDGCLVGKSIAPLILLPFIENSFKHGANSGINNPVISILIKITDDKLHLKVENSKLTAEINKDHPNNSGIGMKNVKRRLDLLYKDAYTLDIEESANNFKIDLSLDLDRYGKN